MDDLNVATESNSDPFLRVVEKSNAANTDRFSETKSKRGGPRPGAGRKKKSETILLESESIRKIKEEIDSNSSAPKSSASPDADSSRQDPGLGDSPLPGPDSIPDEWLEFIAKAPFEIVKNRTGCEALALDKDESKAIAEQMKSAMKYYFPQIPTKHLPGYMLLGTLATVSVVKYATYKAWLASGGKAPTADGGAPTEPTYQGSGLQVLAR